MKKPQMRFLLTIAATLVVGILSIWLPSLRLTGDTQPEQSEAPASPPAEQAEVEDENPEVIKHRILGRYFSSGDMADKPVMMAEEVEGTEEMREQLSLALANLAAQDVLPEAVIEANTGAVTTTFRELTFSDGQYAFTIWSCRMETDWIGLTLALDGESGQVLYTYMSSATLTTEDFSATDDDIRPYMDWASEITAEELFHAWGGYTGRALAELDVFSNTTNPSGEFDYVCDVTYADGDGREWTYRFGWALTDEQYMCYIRPYTAGS